MDFKRPHLCSKHFILLLSGILVATAIIPIEKFHAPKPYSFGYAIKDKHGEQHRKEIGDGLHKVRGSYGFKDDRGIERLVNYVADKGGFRAEIKTNEPGTAALHPAAVKMESSAHPYFGIPKEAAAAKKEPVFAFPELFKFEELAKEGLALETGLAKEAELEKGFFETELGKEELALGTGLELGELAKEGFTFSGEGLAKEAEKAKEVDVAAGLGLKELLKQGFSLVSFGLVKGAEEAALEKGLATEKALGAEEFAKLGLHSPLAFGLKEAELEKEGLALEESKKLSLLSPKFGKAGLLLASAPKGFAYGGPIVGGLVKHYDARFY